MPENRLRTVILVNILNLVLLGLISAVFFIFPRPVAVASACFWFAWTAASNAFLLLRRTDPEAQLLAISRRHGHAFQHEIGQILAARHSVLTRKDFFECQNDPIRDAYGLILQKTEANVLSAIDYMRCYDFVSRPPAAHMAKLAGSSDEIMKTTNELAEVLFHIDDSLRGVDTSELDDLIAALSELASRKI